MRLKTLIIACGVVGLLGGCAGKGWRNERVDPKTERSVDYRFDDDDARRVYAGMVDDALRQRWLDRWAMVAEGREPKVLVGRVRNATEDYIDTRLFTKRIEEELINSGRVRMLADPSQQQDLAEAAAASLAMTPEELLARGQRLGADYVMLGWIGDHKSRSADGSTLVNYYQVSLDLIAVETSEKVWTKTVELEKVATRR